MLPTASRLILLAGLLALSPSPGQAQQDTPYTIRPGDRITLEVFSAAGQRIEVVAGLRVVDRNGEIHLPYVGTMKAQGLDQNSLREAMVQAYGAFYPEPVINVKVELRINVTGAVPRPGQYYMDPSATVIDALAQAGGATSEYAVIGTQVPSDQRRVRLVRDGERFILNLHPAEVTDDALGLRVLSGDWLHVPPETRTAVRDQVLFWGSLVSFASGIASLIVLITR